METNCPIYLEIYENIKKNIQQGILRPKEKLESKRALARRLNVGINTVENAYAMLIEEGYIEPIQRRGYFVANQNLVLRPLKESKNVVHSLQPEYTYDFSCQGVDENFPFALWKRLTKEALDMEKESLLQRGEAQGQENLRESIAAYLQSSRGIEARKENIVVHAGTEHLFQILFRLWAEKKVFGIENPGFELWSMLFETNDMPYLPLKMDKYGVLPGDVQKKAVDILCITPSHQFPTGTIMPIGRRKEILSWAEKAGRYIIEDDYDGEFKYKGRPVPPLKSIDTDDKVIYMGNFGSTISPAIRVSYMLLPDSLMKKYHQRLAFHFCPVPVLTQNTLYLFLSGGYFIRHVNKMRKIYREKREIVLHELKNSSNLTLDGIQAGLNAVLVYNGKRKEEELCLLAQKRGVFIYGMSKYCVGREKLKKPSFVLRFSGLSKEKIQKGMRELKEAWKENGSFY